MIRSTRRHRMFDTSSKKLTAIDDTLDLAFTAREMMRFNNHNVCVYPERLVEVVCHGCLQRTKRFSPCGMKRFIGLYPYFQFIQLITLSIHENLVVTGQTGVRE